jgi:hypothetical protein
MVDTEKSIIDNIETFILQNTHNSNSIKLHYGKKIDEFIFNTKFNNSNLYNTNVNTIDLDNINLDTINKYDIISIINSYLAEDIKHITLKKQTNIYFEDLIYNIEEIIESSKPINNFNTFIKDNKHTHLFTSTLNNFEIYTEQPDYDICLKANKIHQLQMHEFENINMYNFKETYLNLEWDCIKDIKLNMNIYEKYFTLHIVVVVNEVKQIPTEKLKQIFIIFNKLDKILTNYIKFNSLK